MTKVEELKEEFRTIICGLTDNMHHRKDAVKKLKSFEQAVREDDREKVIKLIIKELPDSCFMPNNNHDESTIYNHLKGVLTQPTKEM